MLRLLFVSLLALLAVALGTEGAALHRRPRPAAGARAVPVVVRKSSVVPMPRKSVHALGRRAG